MNCLHLLSASQAAHAFNQSKCKNEIHQVLPTRLLWLLVKRQCKRMMMMFAGAECSLDVN